MSEEISDFLDRPGLTPEEEAAELAAQAAREARWRAYQEAKERLYLTRDLNTSEAEISARAWEESGGGPHFDL